MNKNRFKKYMKHRNDAKHRGISWEFTYMQWTRIWLESGHWHERGRSLGKYCMARYGDTGPYAVRNVKIILHSENSSEGNLGNQYCLGKKHTPEALARMSAAKNDKRLSAEHRAKISAALKGNQNMFGKKHNPETRARMSAARIGKKHTLKARAKMSAAQKGNQNALGKRHCPKP